MRIELIYLGDQIIDALDRILSVLVDLENPLVEGRDPSIALFEIAAQLQVLGLQSAAPFDQCGDGALEAIEVVCAPRLALSCVVDSPADSPVGARRNLPRTFPGMLLGNRSPLPHTSYRETAKAVKLR